jgi:hypothetical protein
MNDSLQQRYFISYSGVSLPLKLTNELEPDGMDNRITYFIGYFDDEERLRMIEKVVYGEIEFSHEYEYDDQMIRRATLIEDGEDPRVLEFDDQGRPREVS